MLLAKQGINVNQAVEDGRTVWKLKYVSFFPSLFDPSFF